MRGLEGNMQAEPRVFAHDAIEIEPSTAQIANTEQRGCCIYVGGAGLTGTLVVKLESGKVAAFKGLAPGSFLPILVTHVLINDGKPIGSATTDCTDIIALF